jgi:hypothetical protein
MCHRKLLAMGSPACSYCGQRLPSEYIKAREADLKRITGDEPAGSSEPGRKIDEFFSEAGRRKRGRSSSGLDVLDITSLLDVTSLIDFFS